MKLISRDCCPYLDDFEPDYVPAVAATAFDDVQTTFGDPKGPTFVEPLTASIHMRLPDGESAAAEAGLHAHSWSNSNYDAGKNSSGSNNYDLLGLTQSSNQGQHNNDVANPSVPGVSSPRDGRG